jgi:radical SAM protein (TIGR04043 family)
MNNLLMKMKLELLCNGVRISNDLQKKFPGYKYKRASLSEGMCFDIWKEGISKPLSINLAVHEKFVSDSPFYYDETANVILKNNRFYLHAKHIKHPEWYSMKLNDNTPFNEIFQLHYNSILAISLTNFCEYKTIGKGCKFCAMGFQVKQQNIKPVQSIVNVLKSLLEKEYEFTEVNINSGAMVDNSKGLQIYLDVIRSIREVTDLPIYAQMCPPKSLSDINKLGEAGATSVSFNMEIFDEDLRLKMMPIKGKIPISHYIESMSHAINIFGKGQVSSWLIAGLEPAESTIKAIKLLTELGVIPFVTIFRPLTGSELEDAPPPAPDSIAPIFIELSKMLRKMNLNPDSSKCGCVKCNCCSALPEVLF